MAKGTTCPGGLGCLHGGHSTDGTSLLVTGVRDTNTLSLLSPSSVVCLLREDGAEAGSTQMLPTPRLEQDARKKLVKRDT